MALSNRNIPIRKDRGGLVVGDSHAEGGVPFELTDTGTHIEEEGDEVNIPREIADSDKVYEFEGTNYEILNEILKLGGLKLSSKVTEVKSGDIVICIKSAWDDVPRKYKGTVRQILSAINESRGCNHIESGAKMTNLETGATVTMGRGGEAPYTYQPQGDYVYGVEYTAKINPYGVFDERVVYFNSEEKAKKFADEKRGTYIGKKLAKGGEARKDSQSILRERVKNIVEKLWGSKSSIGLNTDERGMLEDLVKHYLDYEKFFGTTIFAYQGRALNRLIKKNIVKVTPFGEGMIRAEVELTDLAQQEVEDAIENEKMSNGGEIKRWIDAVDDNSAYDRLKTPIGRIWTRHSKYDTRKEAEAARDSLRGGFYKDAQILELRNTIWVYVVEREPDREPVHVITVIENGKRVKINAFSEKERDENFEDIKKRGLKIISVKSIPYKEWKKKNKMMGGEIDNDIFWLITGDIEIN